MWCVSVHTQIPLGMVAGVIASVPNAPVSSTGHVHASAPVSTDVSRGFATLQIETANFRSPLFVFIGESQGPLKCFLVVMMPSYFLH
jgi:hypothetical protein